MYAGESIHPSISRRYGEIAEYELGRIAYCYRPVGVPDCPQDGFRTRMNVDLDENAPQMRLHSPHAEDQSLRDIFVREASGEETEHVNFTFRQRHNRCM